MAPASSLPREQGKSASEFGVLPGMAEHRRDEQARLLTAVFDLLPVGVWIADRSGRVVSNNPAAERIWCGARPLPVEQFGQYQGWFIRTGEPVGAAQWPLARALLNNETCAGELIRIRCFDGSFKTIVDSAAPLCDEHGVPIGAIGVNEDITGLQAAQERQRASEDLMRTVFDLLPVGLRIVDRDGSVTQVNPAAAKLWQGAECFDGEQPCEFKGWWFETGRPIEPREWGLARALHEGRTSARELIRIQCADGSFKTLINWAAPIRSRGGDIVGAVAINEDVTAMQQIQEQLRSAVRAREDILAIVTHDLRSPLSSIRTLAATIELKAKKLAGGEAVSELAGDLSDIARHTSSIVKDLLSVAILGSERPALQTVPTKVSDIVRQALSSAAPLFARSGLRLEVRVGESLPAVRADASRLWRVLANLLDNALKFTEPPGDVLLTAQARAEGVCFAVSNSGAELSAQERDNMFKPFWQGHSGDVRGTGLGLSICRSIVEAHGGSIWAEPAAGRRVRVCFIVPYGEPVAHQPP
ncbi:sensor histidine kinase [Ramlibacter sp.]|uniref:sensor histidine kinase n=1 Tax=Ramlibacter sp. TaxID=1917967 RepID=UPI002C20DEC2|nr:ATP-binding protein [Ramlibacter sp.]HWI81020.1 ATP-binding protein [Ramlibacter sp.]